MRVADVMETRVDVADAGTGADEAWAHMQQHDLQSLIVTDAGRIVGILGRERLAGPGASLMAAIGRWPHCCRPSPSPSRRSTPSRGL